MTRTPGSILLADDDRVDGKAFVRALARLGCERPVTIARDGQEAWELLVGTPPLRPSMIVLDINMPRLNGIEVLRRIRGEKILGHIPVFVLTTSDNEADRLDALELAVNGYIVKSELASGLQRALRDIAAA